MKNSNYYRNGVEFIYSMENQEQGVFIIIEKITGAIMSESYFLTYAEAHSEIVAQDCAGYWEAIELVKASN